MGRAILANGDFTAYVCDSAATRPSSQITLRKLVLFSLLFLHVNDFVLHFRSFSRKRITLVTVTVTVHVAFVRHKSTTTMMKTKTDCSPLDADGHQRPDGGVERRNEDESLRLAERQAEQPATIDDELYNLRHAEQHDDEVGDGEI